MPAERDQKAPEEQERQRMLTYIGVLATAAAENRNAYQLTTTEVDDLDEMVGTHYDRPSNWASNLLCAVYGRCRAPYTGNAGAPKGGGRTRDTTEPIVERVITFGLQPNPTRHQVTFLFDRSGDGEGQGRIVVRDLAGRTVVSLPMNGLQGQQTWDVHGTAPGTYVVEYLAGAQLLHSERLVIQR